MKRAAAEVAKTLRKKLIQAAYQNPAIRQETMGLVAKLAGQDQFGSVGTDDPVAFAVKAVLSKLPNGNEEDKYVKYLFRLYTQKRGWKPGMDWARELGEIDAKIALYGAHLNLGTYNKKMHDTWKALRSAIQGALSQSTKLAGQNKVAINEETEEFIRWALSTQAPMSANEVESFVNRTLNIKTSVPVPSREGPRYRKGDSVEIIEAKHKDRKYDIGPYKLYNGKIGTVVDADGMDVLVSFPGHTEPVRFPGGMAPRNVGVMKYTEPYEITGSDKFEMIYLADPSAKTTGDQKATVDVYISRGKTEKRSANYYTGFVTFGSTSKEGNFYFRGAPQQRMRVDPSAEGGYQFRTFSPAKGKVLYIGLFGKRPSNWKTQLEDLDSKAQAV